ncbi:hypothetical protein Sste5346_006327 [Sporothrix stenoceras]|uniref:Uncharacterized protein n=1 Tax=Sporothrix stenoceras TaxID=5173 RepID=A0ABR3YYN2_9PEZI
MGNGEKIYRGDWRCAVVARLLVKRRWQKLGNGPLAWQHGDLSEDSMEELVRRDADLLQGMRHGEYAPMQPRSRLTQASSDSQAEAFLISRPWFRLAVE